MDASLVAFVAPFVVLLPYTAALWYTPGVREALAVVPDNSDDEAVVSYLRQYRERMLTFERFEGMIRGAPGAAAGKPASGAVGR